MTNKSRRRRVLRRDRRLCGIHLGGYGQPIVEGKSCELDHIIPQRFFSNYGTPGRHAFNDDWNCQPMHPGCNRQKASRLDGWPQFKCKCHYLQVMGSALVVVCQGSVGSGKYPLLPNVLSARADKVDARVMIGRGKLAGRKVVGASAGMKQEFGYMLPGIAASRVDMFNLRERARVGLRIPKLIHIDDNGRMVAVGKETVAGRLEEGDYTHFPSLRVPDGGIALVGAGEVGEHDSPG